MAKICKGNRKNYCKIKLHFPQPKKNWISLKLNEKSSKCNGESTFGEIWSDYVENRTYANQSSENKLFCHFFKINLLKHGVFINRKDIETLSI